ncbi:MAG: preprotein translocase subunit SecE [Candidatus Paceibacterota bacterium]
MNYVTQFINYVKDTQGEMLHVSWPTRRQAIIYTVIVIAISLAIALFLGFFDWIFSVGLNTFVL